MSAFPCGNCGAANRYRDRAMRRRRECPECNHRFTTFEIRDEPMLTNKQIIYARVVAEKIVAALNPLMAERERVTDPTYDESQP